MKKRINITVDSDYHGVMKQMLLGNNLSQYLNQKIENWVIQKICERSLLMCDFENADLTKDEENRLLFLRGSFNDSTRPIPTKSDLTKYIEYCMKQGAGNFERCLEFAIAKYWSRKMLEKEYNPSFNSVTFYLENWLG